MNNKYISAIALFEDRLIGMTVEEMRAELATAEGDWKRALEACIAIGESQE